MIWDELRDLLHEDPEVEHGPGVTEADIFEAESHIGLLPADFRSYLLEFGWLAKEFRQLNGLGGDLHPGLNVVRISLAERRDAPGLPQAAIVFYNNGSGDLSFLDPTGQVRVWLHEVPDTLEFEAPTFTAWLADRFDYRPIRQ